MHTSLAMKFGTGYRDTGIVTLLATERT